MAREQRKLAAILAADVVGYSRLMGRDESGTVARLRRTRELLLSPILARRGGRIVKLTGDGAIIEFASAVEALSAAIEFQQAMADETRNEPPDSALQFRIGLHLGDLIVEGDDLYGDGVNVAARLEAEAPASGIVVSGAARDFVGERVKARFTDLGRLTLKNIERPVHAWRIEWDAADWKDAPITSPEPPWTAEPPALAAALPLPDKPSIAVLPFQNMSGDPEQEYFADGMVEDIITGLSRNRDLFVIARNSSFTYKGRSVDIKQVGRELGVRYVLEGSVRKASGRVRISGQLIEASTGTHLWAEKFDGALEDVFELQDTVTERVVGAIEPSVKRAEINRARTKPTSNLNAYDYYLRAFQQANLYTRAGGDAALDYIRRAIALDPGYAIAKAYLSAIHMLRWIQGWGASGEPELGRAAAREAIILDSDDPSVLRWAGHTLGFWGDYDRSIALLEKAARLNVNGSQILASLGWVKVYGCRDTERAIAHFERAIRLSPRDPEMASTLTGIAFAHLIAGHGEQALAFAQQSIDEGPHFTSGHRAKIAALTFLDRPEEAKAAAEALLTFDPQFTISSRLPGYRSRDFEQRYHAALKAAGLRE